jgi:hypothetical protein
MEQTFKNTQKVLSILILEVDDKNVRVKKSSSIHVSNVGLYDSTVKKAVRVKTAFHP